MLSSTIAYLFFLNKVRYSDKKNNKNIKKLKLIKKSNGKFKNKQFYFFILFSAIFSTNVTFYILKSVIILLIKILLNL